MQRKAPRLKVCPHRTKVPEPAEGPRLKVDAMPSAGKKGLFYVFIRRLC